MTNTEIAESSLYSPFNVIVNYVQTDGRKEMDRKRETDRERERQRERGREVK